MPASLIVEKHRKQIRGNDNALPTVVGSENTPKRDPVEQAFFWA